MDTIISKVDFAEPLKDIDVIEKAAEILQSGGLVAFPTETVYGLGANGLNAEAVKDIYKAKGRPSDNPLILHISDIEELKPLVKEVPENAKKLMKAFGLVHLLLFSRKLILCLMLHQVDLKLLQYAFLKIRLLIYLLKPQKCQ